MAELNVEFMPRWCSIGACIESVMQAIGSSLDFVSILGRTALSFRINVSPRIGVSGPTSLDWVGLLPDMANQLGHEVVMVYGMSNEKGFQHVQREALDFIETFLAEGRPVIAWDIWIPEFGLITGIDEKKQNLIVKTILNDPNKKYFPSKKLGKGTIPFLLAFSFEDPLDDFDELDALQWSFQSAWKHLKGLEKALPSYTLGLEAYNVWIKSLQRQEIAWDGHAYMLQYLLEVRSTIPLFFQRVAQIPEFSDSLVDIFDEIKDIYDQVVLPILAQLSNEFPFRRPFRFVTDSVELAQLIANLEKIRESEEKVANLLRKIR